MADSPGTLYQSRHDRSAQSLSRSEFIECRPAVRAREIEPASQLREGRAGRLKVGEQLVPMASGQALERCGLLRVEPEFAPLRAFNLGADRNELVTERAQDEPRLGTDRGRGRLRRRKGLEPP